MVNMVDLKILHGLQGIECSLRRGASGGNSGEVKQKYNKDISERQKNYFFYKYHPIEKKMP